MITKMSTKTKFSNIIINKKNEKKVNVAVSFNDNKMKFDFMFIFFFDIRLL